MKVSIFEVTSIPEIRSRVVEALERKDFKDPSDREIDDGILSLMRNCNGNRIDNLRSAILAESYATDLMPILYYGIDDSEREGMVYTDVEFTDDFGPFHKGDYFETVHLMLDGFIMAYKYDDDTYEAVTCRTKLIVIR